MQQAINTLILAAREWAFVLGSGDYTEKERKGAEHTLERAVIAHREGSHTILKRGDGYSIRDNRTGQVGDCFFGHYLKTRQDAENVIARWESIREINRQLDRKGGKE